MKIMTRLKLAYQIFVGKVNMDYKSIYFLGFFIGSMITATQDEATKRKLEEISKNFTDAMTEAKNAKTS